MANKVFHVIGTTSGWSDTFSSFVCVAPDAEHARRIHPNRWRSITWSDAGFWVEFGAPAGDSTWDHSIETVTVVEIGVANPEAKIGILCSSFHAG